MRRYLIIVVTIFYSSCFAQRLTIGFKENVYSPSSEKTGLGIMNVSSSMMYHALDPSIGQEKFHYITPRMDNRSFEVASKTKPRLFLRYYAKNRWFFELTHDAFRSRTSYFMTSGLTGYEGIKDSIYVDSTTAANSQYSWLGGTYTAKAFVLMPSINFFILDKTLFKPYISVGVPICFLQYAPGNQDIYHQESAYGNYRKTDQDFLFSKVDIKPTVLNYQVGLGVQCYQFFIEAGFINNITSFQESGLYKSLPRTYFKVGLNLLDLKKIYNNHLKKQIVPKETELY